MTNSFSTKIMARQQRAIDSKKPLFTTKHYKAIELILNKVIRRSTLNQMTAWELAGMFREMFEKDNPKFNEKDFRKNITK